MVFPREARIVEVGPRDGLQNEPLPVIPVETRIEFINRLSRTGLKNIEAGSFVSPRWIPQMEGTGDVIKGIARNPGIVYSALIPNVNGLKKAIEARVDEVAILAAASETFSMKNLNCSISESIERLKEVIEEAEKHGIPVRGSISTAVTCPYEGEVSPDRVTEVAKELFGMGCREICVCDTTGTCTPLEAKRLIEVVTHHVPIEKLAVHFHDTYGQALVNIYAVLEEGISIVESSVGGLGGCPYAEGASGNVATEDVVFMLEGLGIETGIDLANLIEAGNFITSGIGRVNESKVSRAGYNCSR